MRFPYGMADFYAVATEGYFYVDRTDRIRRVEETGKQLLMLRPRRFGKSLWLSTLENYYDLAKANEFEQLFGQLAIGKNPTPRHNQYFILRLDFSMVKSQGTVQEVEKALHQHINGCIEYFIAHYYKYLNYAIENPADNGIRGLQSVVAAVSKIAGKLYLLIDEYDNFANEVMIARRDNYDALVHGEGIIKTVFKAVKALSAGQGIDRVFMTGVSPVVLSDITSGYNVIKNISERPEYADLCGFRPEELRYALEQVARECQLSGAMVAEALELMRTFYNGYRFCEHEEINIYNPTLALYFLEALQSDCRYPDEMLDDNLAMDRNRIAYIARLPHGQDLVTNIANSGSSIAINRLERRFGVEMMLNAPQDHGFLASLLYYFGVLTHTGRNSQGKLTLTVPNLVVRKLYIESIQEAFIPGYELTEQRLAAADHFYATGELAPICDFIERNYFPVFDNRDLRWSNELVIKTAFLTTLFNDSAYIMDSETALATGYSDLSLILRPDMRRYALFDHLLEFKYVPLNKIKLSAAELNSTAREQLGNLPLVQEELQAARVQLGRYRAVLEKTYGAKLKLRTHAVVCIGLTRLVW